MSNGHMIIFTNHTIGKYDPVANKVLINQAFQGLENSNKNIKSLHLSDD
jgi:hypothetical protein